MNEVTPYPAINTVLTEWADGLKHLLGKKIVGLYLSGSLAYGDFIPERSDIDLQAVVLPSAKWRLVLFANSFSADR
jgi:predicted nucleotidyltransferase